MCQIGDVFTQKPVLVTVGQKGDRIVGVELGVEIFEVAVVAGEKQGVLLGVHQGDEAANQSIQIVDQFQAILFFEAVPEEVGLEVFIK